MNRRRRENGGTCSSRTFKPTTLSSTKASPRQRFSTSLPVQSTTVKLRVCSSQCFISMIAPGNSSQRHRGGDTPPSIFGKHRLKPVDQRSDDRSPARILFEKKSPRTLRRLTMRSWGYGDLSTVSKRRSREKFDLLSAGSVM